MQHEAAFMEHLPMLYENAVHGAWPMLHENVFFCLQVQYLARRRRVTSGWFRF